MKYVALLRGLNVGGTRKVPMQHLRELFVSLGYVEVSTYINSGNVFFSSDLPEEELQEMIPQVLEEYFGFVILTLIKSESDIQRVADSIPAAYQNNKEQKTDVAYLFPSIDSPTIVDQLPINQELVELWYVAGAVVRHLQRSDYAKSGLNKLISSPYYSSTTIRNVNTARKLARR